MRKFDYFWATNEDWYHVNQYGDPVLNEDAPREAIESYRRYLEQRKAANTHAKEKGTMD